MPPQQSGWSADAYQGGGGYGAPSYQQQAQPQAQQQAPSVGGYAPVGMAAYPGAQQVVPPAGTQQAMYGVAPQASWQQPPPQQQQQPPGGFSAWSYGS